VHSGKLQSSPSRVLDVLRGGGRRPVAKATHPHRVRQESGERTRNTLANRYPKCLKYLFCCNPSGVAILMKSALDTWVTERI